MSSPPFGIQKGFSKDDIKVGGELRPFIYEIPAVPNPHSDFPLVFAQITPLHGVSCVIAQTKLIASEGDYGVNFKKLFDKFVDQLSKKYKKPNHIIDNYGSITKELFKSYGKINEFKDVEYYGLWDGKEREGNILLPNNLIFIELGFNSADNDHDKKYFFLKYFYDNYELAKQEIKNMKENALREKNNMDENAL
tara:strand:+ start:182 stop:763 length:582 start_codon:yes stop_codon:yes gene_type:complete